jgi:hypothetical protein
MMKITTENIGSQDVDIFKKLSPDTLYRDKEGLVMTSQNVPRHLIAFNDNGIEWVEEGLENENAPFKYVGEIAEIRLILKDVKP